MPIIKLDAIDSTNEYLKQLSKESDLDNYTIVLAKEQTQGKGQMGSKWLSEKDKNLTMSILLKDVLLNNTELFTLNIVVSLAVINVLKDINIPNVSIKWPNDIMSDSKKLAGILIENSLKLDRKVIAVVGIGLNLNQTNFEYLPQATSLKCITGEVYDIESIAIQIRNALKNNLELIGHGSSLLWDAYHKYLYKLNYPSAFEDIQGNRFMGIIQKVNVNGKLEVLLEDEKVKDYEVKEIKMLY